MEASPELADLMLRAFTAMTQGDIAFFERHVSPRDGVLAIGTDPQEWWAGAATFLPVLHAQFQEMGGGFPIVPGRPQGFREGAVGWIADRALLRLPDGTEIPFRLTLVVHREDDDWKIVQWHASIGAANEEAIGQDLTV
jgi:hypothetical protein